MSIKAGKSLTGNKKTPQQTPLEIATCYVKRGWRTIPVAYKGKNPIAGNKWQDLRITEENLPNHFNGKQCNIGVMLGDPSNLMDIDLDCPEARSMADKYLPNTDAVFGRKSSPSSHRLYKGATETAQYKDPTDGNTLVELRSNSKKGTPCQTVFPGSVHTSGEDIEWVIDGNPTKVDVGELQNSVSHLAAAALLSKHWPSGSRHEAALALAGVFRRAGWAVEHALKFLEPVFSGDGEYEDRVRCVQDTYAKAEGENLRGIPTLKGFIDPRVINKVCEWLRLKQTASADTPWLEEMNDRFMVVNEGGKTVVYRPTTDPVLDRKILERVNFDDLKKAYLNDRVVVGTYQNGNPIFKTKADAWLEHEKRKQYLGGVTFAPGQKVPADTFNLWQGYAVEPRQGDWSHYKHHMHWVISNGDKKVYDYLIGWMARAVQKPGIQGEVAIVLRGKRGSGKGTFVNYFGKLFGQHYIYITNAKHLVGNFNAHLRDAVVVFADEAFFAGDRAHASVLKGMVTDPLITIEGKYKNAVTARNVTHLLLASNDDWVVPAGVDERRFCVFEVCSAVIQNHQYFSVMKEQMDSGGLAAMLYDLQNHDLTDFNVRAVPSTDALIDQKIQSLQGPEAWLYDCLQRGEINCHKWDDNGLEIPKGSAYDDYKERHKDFRDYVPKEISSWAKSVRSIMLGAISESRPDTGGSRVRNLVFPPLDHCREVFLNYLGQEQGHDHVWETDDE
jgi:hypothetical protein